MAKRRSWKKRLKRWFEDSRLRLWLHDPRLGPWLRQAASVTAVLAPVAAIVIQSVRLYPFLDDVNKANSRGEDWLTYKRIALGILDEGFSLPFIHRNYGRPGGFLYNYFIAFVFTIFGRSSAYVYLVQGVLMAGIVPVLHFTYRRFLSPLCQVALVAGLALMVQFDMSRWYMQRLLSENLLTAIIPFLFLTILLAYRKRTGWTFFVSGAVAGIGVLARPNLLLVPFGFAILLVLYDRDRPLRERLLPGELHLLGFFASQLPLVLRNVMNGGAFRIGMFTPVFEEANDWQLTHLVPLADTLRVSEGGSLLYYWERLCFVLGFTQDGIVPHWVLMWTGFGILLLLALKRGSIPFWQASAFVFCFLYFGPLIAAGGIYTYGARMIIPGTPIVLILALAAADELAAPLVPQEFEMSRKGPKKVRNGRSRPTRPSAR